jgi:hypothetical protein
MCGAGRAAHLVRFVPGAGCLFLCGLGRCCGSGNPAISSICQFICRYGNRPEHPSNRSPQSCSTHPPPPALHTRPEHASSVTLLPPRARRYTTNPGILVSGILLGWSSGLEPSTLNFAQERVRGLVGKAAPRILLRKCCFDLGSSPDLCTDCSLFVGAFVKLSFCGSK